MYVTLISTLFKMGDKNWKVPLTPQNFIPLIKSTSFLDFFNQEIILIDKICAFLQAFEHVISTFTTMQSGIWV